MNENSRVSQSQNQEIRIALGALHKQLVRLLKSTRNLDSLPLEIRANSAIYAYGQWLKTPIEPLTRLLISNLNVDAEEAKFADALEFATQARKSENKALELASQQTKRASRLLRERRFSRAIISGLILIASFAIGVILQTIFDPKAGGILATGVHEFIIGPVFSISNISFLIGLSAWSYQGWKYTEDDSELA
jgi:hypothetical protein